MNHARKHGFTLVELMVSIALGMILIGVVAFVFQQSSKLYNATLDEMHGTFVLRAGQDILAQDLRDIMLPINADTELRIIAVDGGTGATDTLEYTTVGNNPAAQVVPLKVRVSLNGGFLVREVYAEGDWSPTGYLGTSRAMDLGGDIISFRVEYAWPDGTGMSFRRDTGTGGANAASGGLFSHWGTGSLGTNSFTSSSGPYAGGTPPSVLATTLYVRSIDQGGGFRISNPGATTYQLVDSAPGGGGLEFAVPILPPALRITIQQQTGIGNRARVRSMQRVLTVAR